MATDPRLLPGLGGPPDIRDTAALALVTASLKLAQLRVPAHTPDREYVVADVAFTAALSALLDAAQQTGARIIQGIAVVAVERGRKAEMPYSEIVTAMHVAMMESVTAHAENEAEAKERKP